MNLGLDFHGVLNANPEEFIEIATGVKAKGGKVFIITGSSNTPEFMEDVNRLGTGFWDQIVSVQDELMKSYNPIGINEFGRPVFTDTDWNSFKGKFCREHGIDLHYDDSEEYI